MPDAFFATFDALGKQHERSTAFRRALRVSQSTAHRLRSNDLCLLNAVVYLWTSLRQPSIAHLLDRSGVSDAAEDDAFHDAVVDLLCLTNRLTFPARMKPAPDDPEQPCSLFYYLNNSSERDREQICSLCGPVDNV